jgi:MinD-like ATPase involved in chromosome partitioning or flagellar assembly
MSQLDVLRDFVSGQAPTRPSRHAAHVAVVASGKGGTGTSTVALLLAREAARRGNRTLLVDASASAGSLRALCGAAEIETDPASPYEPSFTPLAEGLVLGSPAPARTHEGPGERQARYRRIAGLYGDFETVMVDAGSALESVAAALTPGAGRLLAVTRCDRVAIAATYAHVKLVAARWTALPLDVIANGCSDVDGRKAQELIAAGATRFLGIDVGFAGALPEDAGLRRAPEAGSALGIEGDSHAARAAGELMDTTLREFLTGPRAGRPGRTNPVLTLMKA